VDDLFRWGTIIEIMRVQSLPDQRHNHIVAPFDCSPPAQLANLGNPVLRVMHILPDRFDCAYEFLDRCSDAPACRANLHAQIQVYWIFVPMKLADTPPVAVPVKRLHHLLRFLAIDLGQGKGTIRLLGLDRQMPKAP